MSIDAFKLRLARYFKINIELVVNNNRSTMLNLLKKTHTLIRLSIHTMFLDAPEPILLAIVDYIKGIRKSNALLRLFIQEHLNQCDYTSLVKQQKLVHIGDQYHLKILYDEINTQYFENRLNLSITWYGENTKNKRNARITFGQYLSGLRLIKIHRILDHSFFPEYFVSFVIYHEMLHSVVPGALDRRGRYCFHHAAFRKQEKAFEQYKQVIVWEKNNIIKIFNKQKYGWT